MKISELKKGVDKGSQKRADHSMATDDPDKYIGKWETYDEPQGIQSPAGKRVTKGSSVTRQKKVSEVHSLGPEFTRTGADPNTVEPPELPRKLRSKKRVPGAKSPMKKVLQQVSRSLKSKNRKIGSPISEVIDIGKPYPVEWQEMMGVPYAQFETSEDQYVVGFEPMQMAAAILGFELPVGVHKALNVGFTNLTGHLGKGELPRILATVVHLIQKVAQKEDVDSFVFMPDSQSHDKLYQRLIKRFTKDTGWKAETTEIAGMKGYVVANKQVSEMIRIPQSAPFNADYEIKDGEDLVGVAAVTDGVIEKFLVKSDIDEAFRGITISSMLGAIIRDADLQHANLSMQVTVQEDVEMKRFLERFGFRHVADGVFKRTAGAITPPSVIY